MRCKRIDQIQIAPKAPHWRGSEHQSIKLMATPLGMQPTPYIQKSWSNKKYGRIAKLDVAAMHDGEMLAVRMSWLPVGGTDKDFPDAVALAMPVIGNPPLLLMGTPEAPIHILHWQAGKEHVRSVLASGVGSSKPGPDINTMVAVERSGKRIDVVIARALGEGGGAAPANPGSKVRLGFAVWDGGNGERAGIKAFSVDWIELALDA